MRDSPSRRTFLRAVAVGAGALAIPGDHASQPPAKDNPPKDVVIDLQPISSRHYNRDGISINRFNPQPNDDPGERVHFLTIDYEKAKPIRDIALTPCDATIHFQGGQRIAFIINHDRASDKTRLGVKFANLPPGHKPMLRLHDKKPLSEGKELLVMVNDNYKPVTIGVDIGEAPQNAIVLGPDHAVLQVEGLSHEQQQRAFSARYNMFDPNLPLARGEITDWLPVGAKETNLGNVSIVSSDPQKRLQFKNSAGQWKPPAQAIRRLDPDRSGPFTRFMQKPSSAWELG